MPAALRIANLQDDHFTDYPKREEDREIGEFLAYHIGDTFIDWNEQSPSEQWEQIAKALRCHGLTIKEAGVAIEDGEAINGSLALFINQMFLCSQSFLTHVRAGKIKGRHHVEGMMEFLDHHLAEYSGSEFSFNVRFDQDLDCMVLVSIDGRLEDPDADKVYRWRWEMPFID